MGFKLLMAIYLFQFIYLSIIPGYNRRTAPSGMCAPAPSGSGKIVDSRISLWDG